MDGNSSGMMSLSFHGCGLEDQFQLHINMLEIMAIHFTLIKKGKRKVQGVPQSQTVALPRPQEEEETDKSKQAQTEQTYEKH